MAIMPQSRRTVSTQVVAPTQVRAGKPDALGPLAAGLNEAADAAFAIQDELDTAAAKKADAAFTDSLNDLLYNDQTGYMYASGGDAIARRETIGQEIDKLYQQSLTGLTTSASKKAKTALFARQQSTLNTVNQHAATERRTYLDSASEARITASLNSAVFDPSTIDTQLSITFGEIDDMAQRNGWAPEVTALKKQEATDSAYYGAIMRAANIDPEAALSMAREAQGEMSGATLAKLETTLVPLAEERKGRNIGSAAARGSNIPAYNYSTKIDYSMGPKRPNAPNKPVMDVIGYSAERVFGTGARVVVTSGQEGDNPQHGSPRHKTGDAADIAVYRPDGTRVTVADPEMREFLLEAARNGATGFGAGDGYMGGDTVHIDLVGTKLGGGTAWAGLGDAMEADLQRIVTERSKAPAEGQSYSDFIASLDGQPERVRDAAIREYELIRGARSADQKAQQAAASQAVLTMIEGGGRISDLPIETRQALAGDVMKEARAYEATIVSGDKPVTDSQTFVDLNRMMAEDPAAFMAQDPMLWRNKLSDSDFQQMVESQRRMKLEGPTKSPTRATAMSSADAALRAAGITKNDKPEEYGAFQTSLLRWIDANPEAAADPKLLDAQINRMLVPVVRDTWLPFDQRKTASYAYGSDVTLDKLYADIDAGRMSIGGEAVTSEDAARATQIWVDRFHSDPTPQQLIEIITLMRENG